MTRPLPVLMLLVTVNACTWSCSDDPSGVEREPPMIRIVFPTEDEYDRDGDGLVDIEIEFEDVGNGIDESTITITTSRPLGPRSEGGEDLMAGFRTISSTKNGICLEETTDALLPAGTVAVVARVSDLAGNRAEVRRSIRLPFGNFHRFIEGPETLSDPIGIEMAPDGSRGFLLPPAFETNLIPFDPVNLSLLPPISTGEDLIEGVVDPTTNKMYLVSLTERALSVLDLRTMAAEAPIQTSAIATGIERAPSGLLYLSIVSQRASASIVDPRQRQELRVIQTMVTNTLNPQEPAVTGTPRFLNSEDVFFLPMLVPPGGVLVVDSNSADVRSVIDLSPSVARRGESQSSVLDEFTGDLYLSDIDGVVHVDLATRSVVRRIDSDGPRPKFLSLSPSRERLFVSAGSGLADAPESWLVDLGSFSVIERFPVTQPNPAGENRSVFRPDGQLIFAVRGTDIAVYLNRE